MGGAEAGFFGPAHLCLPAHTLGYQPLARGGRPEVAALEAKASKYRLFDEGMVLPAVAVEAHGFFQRNRRVGYHPGPPERILGRGVEHERVEQVHVARLAGRLEELTALGHESTGLELAR